MVTFMLCEFYHKKLEKQNKNRIYVNRYMRKMDGKENGTMHINLLAVLGWEKNKDWGGGQMKLEPYLQCKRMPASSFSPPLPPGSVPNPFYHEHI